MARQPEIRYIRYYTDGSAARVQEQPQSEPHKTSLPKPRKRKPRVIQVDLLALGGIVISVVMVLLMVVGFIQLHSLQQTNAYLESYVQSLEHKNAELSYTYRSDLDLEQIERYALSLGMIPQEQAQTITIHVPPQEETREVTAWERFTTFLAGLFA